MRTAPLIGNDSVAIRNLCVLTQSAVEVSNGFLLVAQSCLEVRPRGRTKLYWRAVSIFCAHPSLLGSDSVATRNLCMLTQSAVEVSGGFLIVV